MWFFNQKVARKFRPSFAIAFLKILVKLVLQLGHFVTKSCSGSIVHRLGVSDLGMRPLGGLTIL